MTFELKNTGATYQRTMNLIFHDLIGIIFKVYIDDIVIKSAGCWRLPTPPAMTPADANLGWQYFMNYE